MSRQAILRTLAFLAVAVAALVLFRWLGTGEAPPEAPPVAQATPMPTETPDPTSPAAPEGEATKAAEPTEAAPPDTAEPAPEPSLEPSADPVPAVEPTPNAPQGVAQEPAPADPPAAPTPADWSRALGAVADGDPDTAVPLLEVALQTAEGEDAARLRVALGRTLFEADRYREAIPVLVAVDAAEWSQGVAVEALGLLARAQEAVGDWHGAIVAYDRLLPYAVVPEDVVRFQAARAYAAMGDPATAAAQLEAIDLEGLGASRRAEVLEELAKVRLDLGDPGGAAEAYGQILTFAENDAYIAQVLAKQGDALRDAGRTDEATDRYRQVVDRYADTTSAVGAIQALDELGAGGVTGLQRGVALYAAWRYAEAVEALAAHLGDPGASDRDRAHYYAGLAYQSLGNDGEAINAFDAIVTGDASSPYLDDAWFAKAKSLAAMGEDAAAFYALFADSFPEHGSAARALWLAAEGLERAGDWGRAAHYYNQMHTRYPQDSGAPEARFREGLTAYAGGDLPRAYTVWQGALDAGAAGDARARLLTWLGLAGRRAGEEAAAREHWAEAARGAPESYYGLRAADLLNGVSLAATPLGGSVTDGRLTADDWAAIEAWVASWAGADALAVDVSDLPLVQRGLALWTLNWHGEATEALRLARAEIEDHAGQVLSLLRLCDERGIPPFSIWAADRLPILAARAGGGSPPEALHKASYPTVYGHLVADEAARWGVDPYLFLGLVRQESRFDPLSHSWAGALGLTQVMPATGADIASAIGPANYRHDMLRRPSLSVRFGVWYLSRLLDLCEGDWIAAISSYNGGYGNVSKWANGQIPIADHDLFYEMVPFAETKSYIRLVYENYRLYERTYR